MNSTDLKNPAVKILLVDDHPEVLIGLEEFLWELGYQVFRADSGERAFDLACSHKPDVIVSDVNMPGINGHELVEKLKEIGCTASFVLMTAFGNKERETEGIHAGASALIRKPIDIVEFHQLIMKISSAL